jgi:arylsulfatase
LDFDVISTEENSVMSEGRKLEKPEGSNQNAGLKRRDLLLSGSSLLAASVLSSAGLTTSAQAQQAPPSGKRPNILVIMGDDIGWNNLGSYHQG